MSDELKRTPLFEAHRALGARMVDFGGWEMPVQYSGILAEHRAVRTHAGLFDVSHMGEFEFIGAGAAEFLQKLTVNDVHKLSVGKAEYSMMLYPDGGVVDDLIIYRVDDQHYLVVVNAANIDKDWAWVEEHLPADLSFSAINRSDRFALLALQGPNAIRILSQLTDVDLEQLRYYHITQGGVAGLAAYVARTGYTGEDGFEVFVPPDGAMDLWKAILTVGEEHGILPCGLGARDTLRLEAGMPLYGHELTKEVDPVSAGLARFVAFDVPEFIGREALLRIREEGPTRKLVGFEMVGRGIAREHYDIQVDGKKIGEVASGTFAPTLQKNIGTGYVPPAYAAPGTRLDVVIRGRPVEARVVPLPFYKRKR
jgi:aminomethyltransferase